MPDPVTIACVVGARPNFIKMGPLWEALQACERLRPRLVHTGQHYDAAMSDVFFQQLGLPEPDVHLNVGSGSHARQTADVLTRYESWLLELSPRPAATLVVGDVNSTLACALASVKLFVPVVHVEAGLRSFDRSMPEEINRVLTDAISDLLLVSEPSGVENLRREGRPEESIRLVGNVMIDSLRKWLPLAREQNQPAKLGSAPGEYALWTMHRPSNVDDPEVLEKMVAALIETSTHLPVIFPVHPRSRQRLRDAGLWPSIAKAKGVTLSDPLGYIEFLSLSSQAAAIITDSGGLQEEATALGIPCLTLRENTERPITVTEGSSTLVGQDVNLLLKLVQQIVRGEYDTGRCPELWDGHVGPRIAQEVLAFSVPR